MNRYKGWETYFHDHEVVELVHALSKVNLYIISSSRSAKGLVQVKHRYKCCSMTTKRLKQTIDTGKRMGTGWPAAVCRACRGLRWRHKIGWWWWAATRHGRKEPEERSASLRGRRGKDSVAGAVPTAEWIDLIRSGEFVRATRSVPFFPLVPKLLSLLFCVTVAAALV
jgi:hypothetical protein